MSGDGHSYMPTFNVLGNCSPRYLRSTLYCAPTSNDLLNQCKIPFAVVAQPFATIPDNEVSEFLVYNGPSLNMHLSGSGSTATC